MQESERLRRQLTSAVPLAPVALFNLGLDALDAGLFEDVIARVEQVDEGARDHRLWQLLGLARRSALDAGGAHEAFTRAAALAPDDPLIAHSAARTAHEAGFPAVDRYRRALTLAPADASTIQGLAAAQLAEGDARGACDTLEQTLDANPGWYDGHAAYARLAAAAGAHREALAAPLENALALFPRDPALWRLLTRIAFDARDHAAALSAITRARAWTGNTAEWDRAEAMALGESGDARRAQTIFDRLPSPAKAAEAIHPVRTLIRLERFEDAARLVERQFDDGDGVLWPYRALVWRKLGDPRWQWLEGDPRLVGVYDLPVSTAEITELADTLRRLHARSGTLLDQSVRGGTQTDGHLLARAEPAVRQLSRLLFDAVREHVAQLPAPVAGHPTLIATRAPLRFAGAWSVRLTSGGFHSDHIHSHGWLSSALYIALPESIASDRGSEAGWLTLGENLDLMPGLPAFRTVEPKVGRLVLFPSTMWHGTRPFADGERLTVAFDVDRPR